MGDSGLGGGGKALSTATEILKARLAAGEIDIDEYSRLLAVVTARPVSETQPQGSVLAEVDDVRLYKNVLTSGGRILSLSEVVSVTGSSSSMSYNFVPISKSTWFSVRFVSGDKIFLQEERTYFSGARHKAIAKMYGLVRRSTFQSRLNNLAAKLLREDRIEIYNPYSDKAETVFLTSEGVIETATKSIRLKAAKEHGMFGVGTEWQSLGLSRGYDTEEVVICESKGTLGFIPRGALRFNVNIENADVTNALMIWLAEGNVLREETGR